MSELSFEQMFEESSFKRLRTGEAVTGQVIGVKEDEIILSIAGSKSEGIITRSEFTNEPGVDLRTKVQVGDELEAKVLKVNDGEGMAALSYKRLAADKGLKRLKEAFENKEVLKEKVTQVMEKGLVVEVEGTRVFIPASMVSDTYDKDLSKYAGQEIEFVVTEFNPSGRRSRIIGDRKQILLEKKAAMQKELFEKIEKFASYGFNKSHSVEYSIISYWSCYLRTHYPAEYFASALSIISDEKFEPVVKDAQEAGITVLPPQINHSSAQFEVLDEHRILAPFSSVKYISTNIANKIVKLREGNGGSFSSIEEFKTLASKKGSGVNARAVSNLEKVGSFCEIDSTIPPVDDPSRIKDQKELMGGLILQVVRNPKTVIINKVMKDNIVSIVDDIGKCKDCDLCEKIHCTPSIGSREVKFMIVGDCPSWEEEGKGKFMTGKVGGIVQKALMSAGLSVKNGYYTALVKAKKEGKFLTGEQVAKCSKFLEKEIQVINPAVVVALGSTTIRKFFPDLKASEADGQAIYDPAKNMTIVCGINPAQVLFDEEKMNNLISTFNKVKDVVL